MSTKVKSIIAALAVVTLLVVVMGVGSRVLKSKDAPKPPKTQQRPNNETPPKQEQKPGNDTPPKQEQGSAGNNNQTGKPSDGPDRSDFQFANAEDNIMSAVVLDKTLTNDEENFVQALLKVQYGSQKMIIPVSTYMYYDLNKGDKVDLNLRYSGDAWTVYGIRVSE